MAKEKKFKLIKTKNDNSECVGVYIHIPFCASRCTYCNFNTYVIKKDEQNAVHLLYVDALISEIEQYSSKFPNAMVDTIFIGGGTPSILIAGGIEKILDAVRKNFKVLNGAEISLEINPQTFTKDNAQKWLNAGVNRVSVGLQTSNNEILKTIGRTHTLEVFLSTIQTLKSVGFKSINADLILGLPGQTIKDISHSLKVLHKCKINHVSAYSLILEDETVLYNQVKSGRVSLPSEDETVKMYELVNKFLNKKGLKRYEVSNFARRGFECLHNLNCWKMHHYFGFGAGAHGYLNETRYINHKTIHEYIDGVKNLNTTSFTEQISNDELFEEILLLGLRIKEGINLKQIHEKFNVNLLETKKHTIENFIKLKLIKIKNDRLFLTNKGYYVLNKIILELVY